MQILLVLYYKILTIQKTTDHAFLMAPSVPVLSDAFSKNVASHLFSFDAKNRLDKEI